MSIKNRELLINSLNLAMKCHKEKGNHGYLDSVTGYEHVKQFEAAIEESAVFKAIAGHILFNGYTDVSPTAGDLSLQVFWRAKFDASAESIPAAIDWMLHALSTREGSGKFVCAIWGLEIDREIVLAENTSLLPFDHLPPTEGKRRAEHSALMDVEDAVWISPLFHNAPSAALVISSINLPYIRRDTETLTKFSIIESKAQKYLVLLEALVVGAPLATAHWFEFDDPDLNILMENSPLTWSHAEVLPNIEIQMNLETDDISGDIIQYFKLPESMQGNLARSMRRFVLSLCRHETIDRVLDLVLAFEIAATKDKSDNLSPSWKVSVRPTQLIGGSLEERKANRKTLHTLYGMRNSGTHGGSRIGGKIKTIEDATALYRRFLKALIRLGKSPDSFSIEIGANE